MSNLLWSLPAHGGRERQAMIEEAWGMTLDDVSYIPLHQQGLAWGKKDSIDLIQRADNQFMMYHVNVK